MCYLRVMAIFLALLLILPFPAHAQNIQSGGQIDYYPPGTIHWELEDTDGEEEIEIARLADRAYQFKVIDRGLALSARQNYPVRAYRRIPVAANSTEELYEPVDLGFSKAYDLEKSRDIDITMRDDIELEGLLLKFGHSTTYSASTDYITVTGYTESVPCKFDDLYTADTSATLGRQLLNGTIDANPDMFSLDTQPRPADDLAVFAKISCPARVGATCDISGTDAWGNAISESGLDISGGTATSTNRYATINAGGIIVNGLQIGDNFDIYQDRWGVIWKMSDDTFRVDCRSITIGDGTTATWFADENKSIEFVDPNFTSYALYRFRVNDNAHLRLGTVEGGSVGDNGCTLIYPDATRTHYFMRGFDGSAVELLSSTVLYPSTQYELLFNSQEIAKVWNCSMVGRVRTELGYYDMRDVSFAGTTKALWRAQGGSYDTINVVYSDNLGGMYTGYPFSVSNVYGRCNDMAINNWSADYDGYVLNADMDNWTVGWGGTDYGTKLYRQYELALKVTGEAGEPLPAAMVYIYDNDGDLVVAEQANGTAFYSESFECNLGSMYTGGGDCLWWRDGWGTPSANTGPSSAYDGDWYMYIEASYPYNPDKVAYLYLDDFSDKGAGNVSFQYHMWDNGLGHMGTLEMQVYDGIQWGTLWRESGNQGNEWHNAVVDFDNTVEAIRFKGTTGSGYASDMALDLITVTYQDGSIPTQTLNYGTYCYADGSVPTLHTPHTMTITHDGYLTYYEETFTVDEKLDWVIALPSTDGFFGVLGDTPPDDVTMAGIAGWLEVNMSLIALLAFLVGLATLAFWKRSILLVIPAIIAAGLALPELANYGWHYAAPMLVLAIGLAMMLLYDAVTSGIRI